jgi:hypothetical protein
VTDAPYTDDDLRTEAARQLATAGEDPDFTGISEQMEGAWIASTIVDPDPQTGTERITGTTWDQLGEDDYDAAQRAIDDLIGGAADTSEWAVNLGADGLEPDERQFEVNAGDKVIARVHFAFDPDMADDMRTALVTGLSDALAAHL